MAPERAGVHAAEKAGLLGAARQVLISTELWAGRLGPGEGSAWAAAGLADHHLQAQPS